MYTKLWFILFLTTLSVYSNSAFGDLESLDIFSEKPLKQVYFRYTEGSLRNTPSEAWLKRWSRFDGIVLKAYAEEGAPFNQSHRNTLRQFKDSYPKKALLLHFNGRARNPLFTDIVGTARDFLYFAGSSNKSSVSAGEVISKIYVEKASVFRRNRSLPDGVYDDVVLVKKDPSKGLDWNQYEHAKLLEVNFDNGFIRVQRDITAKGKISGSEGDIHIAKHAAKGPFFKQNKQRLWEYNWFSALDSATKVNSLQQSLTDFISNELLVNNPFWDGVSIDVLTETRAAQVHGYPTLLDFDQDGEADQPSSIFNERHSKAIYQFLEKLRHKLKERKLIIADGAEPNQRAVEWVNGIESEGWPNFRDPNLTQWSSGFNRQRYWNAYGRKPSFSYFKLGDYLDKSNKKNTPNRKVRRLTVAAAILSDAAVSPAHRPKGKPFHKWPEFAVLKKLGKPIDDMRSLRVGERIEVIRNGKFVGSSASMVSTSAQFNQGQDSILFKLVSKEQPVCLELNHSGQITISLEARVKFTVGYPDWRPLKLSLNSETSKTSLMGYVSGDDFTSDYYFKSVKAGLVCISTEIKSQLMVKNLNLYLGPDIRYRQFENGILFANPSNIPVNLNQGNSASQVRSMLHNASLYVDQLSGIVLPAKNFFIVRPSD